MRAATRAALIATLLTSVFSGTASAAGPHDRIVVGNWSGGSYTNDKTGEFNACIASTSYRSGISFYAQVTKNMTWDLAFSDDRWNLKVGEKIPITMIFDGRYKFDFMATAIMPSMVMVPMPDDSKLIHVFRQSIEMKAYARGNVFPFRLDGTSRLIPSLVQCTKDAIAKFGSTPKVGTTLPSNTAPAPSSVQFDIEALRLATNFLLKAQIQNARVLSKDELPTELASYNSGWKGDGVYGAVKIIPTNSEVKGIDIAAKVAGEDSRECKGKFASGRTSELVDSEVVFRGFSSCEDTQGLRASQYFIIPRKRGGGFVLFSVTSSAPINGTSITQKEEKVSDFRKAAFEAAD